MYAKKLTPQMAGMVGELRFALRKGSIDSCTCTLNPRASLTYIIQPLLAGIALRFMEFILLQVALLSTDRNGMINVLSVCNH